MPDTAAAYGLSNPFDAEAATDAQAHLTRDLLQQFRRRPRKSVGHRSQGFPRFSGGGGSVAKWLVPESPFRWSPR
jgi:hypothetical protein